MMIRSYKYFQASHRPSSLLSPVFTGQTESRLIFPFSNTFSCSFGILISCSCSFYFAFPQRAHTFANKYSSSLGSEHATHVDGGRSSQSADLHAAVAFSLLQSSTASSPSYFFASYLVARTGIEYRISSSCKLQVMRCMRCGYMHICNCKSQTRLSLPIPYQNYQENGQLG